VRVIRSNRLQATAELSLPRQTAAPPRGRRDNLEAESKKVSAQKATPGSWQAKVVRLVRSTKLQDHLPWTSLPRRGTILTAQRGKRQARRGEIEEEIAYLDTESPTRTEARPARRGGLRLYAEFLESGDDEQLGLLT
jgi:hypothetical protein